MSKRCGGYFIRFIILHVLTYTVIGVIFFELQDYERAFKVQEYFELFRPLDHPLVMYSMFIQILRGAILAALLYPFHNIFMKEKQGGATIDYELSKGELFNAIYFYGTKLYR